MAQHGDQQFVMQHPGQDAGQPEQVAPDPPAHNLSFPVLEEYIRLQMNKEESGTRWAKDQASLIAPCDGGSVRSVREWMCAMKSAFQRIPDGVNREAFMRELMY